MLMRLFGNVSVVPAKTTIPSSIVSDDFNTPTINTGLWTLVNPLADASFSLSGTNTPDAWVNIGVPGGTAHDPWTSGNNAPRLIQPANNTDFEVEAKFESGVSQRYQQLGHHRGGKSKFLYPVRVQFRWHFYPDVRCISGEQRSDNQVECCPRAKWHRSSIYACQTGGQRVADEILSGRQFVDHRDILQPCYEPDRDRSLCREFRNPSACIHGKYRLFL